MPSGRSWRLGAKHLYPTSPVQPSKPPTSDAFPGIPSSWAVVIANAAAGSMLAVLGERTAPKRATLPQPESRDDQACGDSPTAEKHLARVSV